MSLNKYQYYSASSYDIRARAWSRLVATIFRLQASTAVGHASSKNELSAFGANIQNIHKLQHPKPPLLPRDGHGDVHGDSVASYFWSQSQRPKIHQGKGLIRLRHRVCTSDDRRGKIESISISLSSVYPTTHCPCYWILLYYAETSTSRLYQIAQMTGDRTNELHVLKCLRYDTWHLCICFS